jgi:hypothetical protein
VDYRYYTVDPAWREDKWIRAIEAQIGTRGNIGGFAPGGGTRVSPDGAAVLVPAGSKIVFQMHYTPNGSPQKDRSYAGFVFADPMSVKRRAHIGAASNTSFEIPPGAASHEVSAQYTFDDDMRLLTLAPHMHLRGKSFRYEAEFPDGKREVLLDVPHYDFNWQLKYALAEPRLMPKGTVLHCTAQFDNSEANLANPDPSDTVRFGPQTWHEMMIGWFGVMEDRERTSTK